MGLAGFNRMRRLKQVAEEATKLETVEIQVPEKVLDDMPYQELRALAKEREIEGYHKMNTEELREALKEGG
jgi:hypothetical protein